MTAANASLGETGLRIGLGMEMPVTEQFNVRLDFSHTDYGRQTVFVPGPGNGDERFDIAETLFRLGTAYRF
jgi:opacity protein-like surface antigen